MRYMVLDTQNINDNGFEKPEFFDTLEEVAKSLAEDGEEYYDDWGFDNWRDGLIILEVGEEVKAKIRRSVSVEFSKPTPPPSEPVGDVVPLRDYTGSYGRIDNPSRW